MLRHPTRKHALTLVALFTLLIGSFMYNTFFDGTSQRAHAASASLNVNTGTVIQNNFLGTNAVYHGFSYMPESNNHGMNDTLRAIDFDRVQNIQLHIARTWYGSDWAMPTWGSGYNWNSTKMVAFYNWLQAMKDRNVDVVLSLGWWFTQNVCSPAAPSTCTPRVPEDVDIYTHWVSDSLHQLITVKGFTNIKYGTLFTEPLVYSSGNVPSGYTESGFYQYVAEHLQSRLVSDGTRNLIKIVGPNGSGFNSTQDTLHFAVNNLNGVFDIYSGHDYNLGGYGNWNQMVQNGVNIVSSTGKPFWMDEYGKADENYRNTGDYGTYLAEANAGAINAGAQTTLLWLYEDQYYTWPLDQITNGDSFYNGLHKWGTQQWLPDNINVRAPWYAFSLMSRFLGGTGTQVYSTNGSSNGVTVTATKQPDGNWTVMLINTNTNATDINLSFSGAINKTLYRHLFDPNNVPTNNQLIGASAQFSSVSTSLSDTIPARGVAIYTSINDGSWNTGNLAAGKAVTVSSTVPWTTAYGAANLTNNNLNDFWTSQILSGSSCDEWAYVDLGSQQSFQRVVLDPRYGSGNPVGFPADFQIQGSNDASNWTTLQSQTNFTTPTTGASFWLGSQSYRYVRVHVSAARTDGANYYVQFAEIEVYNNALSSGHAVTASSTVPWTTDYAPGKLTDNNQNEGDFWTSQILSSSSCDEWAYVDLGSQRSFQRVALYPRNGSGVAAGFPADFQIQGSNDASNWTTLQSESNFPIPTLGTGATFAVGSQSYRYVRVHVSTARTDGVNYYVQLAELEVY